MSYPSKKVTKKSQALHILLNMMEATRKKKKMQHILEKQRVFCGFLFVCFVLVWLVRPPHSEKVLGLNPVWSLFEWPLRGDLSGYLSFHPQSKDMHGVRFSGNSNLPVGISRTADDRISNSAMKCLHFDHLQH